MLASHPPWKEGCSTQKASSWKLIAILLLLHCSGSRCSWACWQEVGGSVAGLPSPPLHLTFHFFPGSFSAVAPGMPPSLRVVAPGPSRGALGTKKGCFGELKHAALRSAWLSGCGSPAAGWLGAPAQSFARSQRCAPSKGTATARRLRSSGLVGGSIAAWANPLPFSQRSMGGGRGRGSGCLG